jgi:uncharacterized membrane protein YphA (DoxX/SURF4 family)
MATDATTTSSSSDPSISHDRPCCSEKTLAYLLLRLLLGTMLLLAGIEKFKSGDAPYTYGTEFWHDLHEVDDKGRSKKDANGEPVIIRPGRWLTVAKPIYEFGGFNNADVFQIKTFLDGKKKDGSPIKGGERISNFISRVFFYFAQTLPYLMILSGLMILFGFLNRVGLFLGGAIWFSLAAGQMILPDNPTVFMLSQYTLMVAVALALVKYNRFAITRF